MQSIINYLGKIFILLFRSYFAENVYTLLVNILVVFKNRN